VIRFSGDRLLLSSGKSGVVVTGSGGGCLDANRNWKSSGCFFFNIFFLLVGVRQGKKKKKQKRKKYMRFMY
jgi:hypothetical protein